MISKNIERICKEYWLIENYEAAIADTTQIWQCHHRKEISDGVIMSAKDLDEAGLYFNRPPEELIFLTLSEHTTLHKKRENMKKETLEKISATSKGRKSWSKGKKGVYSEETLMKLRNAWVKRRETPVSEETRAKQSAAHKGKHIGPLKKYQWLDSDGNIHTMDESNAKRWHPDWTKLE